MNKSALIRSKAFDICEEICKEMNQSTSLTQQKFDRIINDVEKRNRNIAFMSLELFYTKVYNEALTQLHKRISLNL